VPLFRPIRLLAHDQLHSKYWYYTSLLKDYNPEEIFREILPMRALLLLLSPKHSQEHLWPDAFLMLSCGLMLVFILLQKLL